MQSPYYEVDGIVDRGSFNKFNNVMWTYPDASSKHGLFLSTSHHLCCYFPTNTPWISVLDLLLRLESPFQGVI